METDVIGTIIRYVINHWVEWLFAGGIALLGYGFRQLRKQQREESIRNAAMREGVEALLRDRVIQAYNHYHEKGFCPIYAKENVRRMYEAYHSLGGNDVATKLKDELMDLPTEPDGDPDGSI